MTNFLYTICVSPNVGRLVVNGTLRMRGSPGGVQTSPVGNSSYGTTTATTQHTPFVSGDSSDATNVVGDAAPDGLHPFCVTTPGTFTFSTCGGATWDTHLRLFDQVPGGTELAENDDSCDGYQYASTFTYNFVVGCYVLVVEGYTAVQPLTAAEVDALPVCIAARRVTPPVAVSGARGRYRSRAGRPRAS
mgnify:CR=1 FL=1